MQAPWVVKSGPKRVEKLKKQLYVNYIRICVNVRNIQLYRIIILRKGKSCFHKCLGFANQAVQDTSANHR